MSNILLTSIFVSWAAVAIEVVKTCGLLMQSFDNLALLVINGTYRLYYIFQIC